MKFFSIVFTLICLLTSQAVVAQSFDTEIIRAELYTDTIKRTGKLDFKRTLGLAFKSSGYLTLLNVDEGQQFNKGQLLASLDITELKETKNSHYAQLLQAKREVERISKLMDAKLASERDLDNAITQVETMRAAYKVAYYNLEKAQIYAPFSGVVLARNTELGELQTPGQEVLTIAKLEWVIKVALTGQEVSQVALEQPVKVSLNNIGLIEGKISKIPAISNSSSNLFTIEVSLPNLKLAPGMIAGQLAGISIPFDSNKFVYRLPIAALVGVDNNGMAVVIAQPTEDENFKQHSFEVFQLDNDFVYLKASRNDEPLKIITKGWQDFTVGGQ